MAKSEMKYDKNTEMQYNEHVQKCSWQTFREVGMLWWINMILHTFGWAICIDINVDTGEIIEVFPARVKFRGFDSDINTKGYIKVSKYLSECAPVLLEESKE